MITRALLAIVASLTIPTHAASLSDAFTQGTTFGRTGNAAARGQITGDTARSTVPSFTTTTPEASYFGGAGLGTPAAARAGACIATSTDPACKAVEFSQTNPSRRPAFSITATDPLLTGAQAITADSHRIAGNLAGTYSGCTTRTSTTPDIFETHFCNEYRILERQTCEKTLSVTITDNGLNCAPGALITPNPRIVFIRPYVFVGALCADEIKFQWTYGYSEYPQDFGQEWIIAGNAERLIGHDERHCALGVRGKGTLMRHFLRAPCPPGALACRVPTRPTVALLIACPGSA